MYPFRSCQYTRCQILLQLIFLCHGTIKQFSTSLQIGMLQHKGCFQTTLLLQFILHAGRTLVVILVDRCHLERSKHIVLVGSHKLIGRQHIIIRIRQRQRINRILTGKVFLLVERIFHLSLVFRLLVLKTIRIISA